jgi:hypothetical protein
MMSLESIRYESRRAAAKAAKTKKTPFVVEAEDLEQWKAGNLSGGLPFPMIGTYEPKGWTKIGESFVDASGFGSESEPALTINQFINQLTAGHGYAIIEAGQFQVYIGEYVKG